MQSLITHQDCCVTDDLFCDQHLSATRSWTNIIQKQPQPHQESGFYIWLDGDFAIKMNSVNSLISLSRTIQVGITNVAFLCGGARGLPFGDEGFDVVFSEGV